jgi:transducin (beta)-like 1
MHVLNGHKKSVYSLRWAPTGEGSHNPGLDAMLATYVLSSRYLHFKALYHITFCSASFDSTVKLWDPTTGKVRSTLAKHSTMVYALAFSPNGEYVASGSSDRSVHIWSARDGTLVRSFTAPSGVFDISFSRNGDKLAASCANSSVALVDLRY